MNMKIWQYNQTTGFWNCIREVSEETKDQWLAILQKHAPTEIFKIAKRKPKTFGDAALKGK